MTGTFLMGAVGYPVLEMLYRRRTHYSMAVAGGLGACIIRSVSGMNTSLPVKMLLCGAGITGVELLCGLIWNRRHQVWDYRHMPLNYRGQICLPYTLLWCGLSVCMLPLLKK